MTLTLVTGTRNYSSWSMRPWLFFRHFDVKFDEILVNTSAADFAQRIRRYNGALKVPVLIDNDTRIWDSLAICEHVAETIGAGWPRERMARAIARSVSAEMHSGFPALRRQCPFNARARDRSIPPTPELLADVRRIDEIWQECRAKFGGAGPWLFGAFSIADALYAPVVLRFRTYGAAGLSPISKDYMETVQADTHVNEWLHAAEVEPYTVEATDAPGT